MTDTAQLIHDLEHADAETCYEAVHNFAEFVLGKDDPRRLGVLMAWSVAMNTRQPDLLLGVVAALVPEGWEMSVDPNEACLTLPGNGFLSDRGDVERYGRNVNRIEACALAAAILRSRDDER